MLKNLMLNGKSIPVPVPVRNLSEAVRWVEDSLMKNGEVLTRVVLDDREFPCTEDPTSWAKFKLKKKSVLSLQCDSPRDLAIQTLDAVRDLAQEIDKRLKYLAVKCWQIPEAAHINEVRDIVNDLGLELELVDHINGMVDFSHKDMAALNGTMVQLKVVRNRLSDALAAENWQQCSRILLNRLEPLLRDMVMESESVEVRLFSAEASEDQLPSANLQLTSP